MANEKANATAGGNHAVFTMPSGFYTDPLTSGRYSVSYPSTTWRLSTDDTTAPAPTAEQRARMLIDQLQTEGKDWRKKAQVAEAELARMAKLLMALVQREGGEIVFTDTELEAIQGGRLIYDDEKDVAGFTRLHAIPDFVAIGKDEEEPDPAMPWDDMYEQAPASAKKAHRIYHQAKKKALGSK